MPSDTSDYSEYSDSSSEDEAEEDRRTWEREEHKSESLGSQDTYSSV